MSFTRLDVGPHLTILSLNSRQRISNTFNLIDEKIIDARSVVALIDDEKNEYGDNYLVSPKGFTYKISNKITAEIESLTPETSKSLSHENDCIVSCLRIKDQGGSSPFFVTQLKVAGDVPLLESSVDKKTKDLVLDALYKNYRRSLTDLQKIFIYAANPQHAWQIILTFLFFEAYRYQDKVRNMWEKDSSVESEHIRSESNKKIIADLREQYKEFLLSDRQIAQAELNNVALYNYIKQDENRHKTLNNRSSAHLCHLKSFQKLFAKDEKSHSEQIKLPSVDAAEKTKKPAVIGFFQGLFSCREVKKDKDEKRSPSKWRCCFPNFY